MQNFAATGKIIDNETRTVLVFYMSELFIKEFW